MANEAESRRATKENEWLERTPGGERAAVPLAQEAVRDKAKINREATIGSFRPPRYEYRGLRYAKYLVNWLNEPQVPSRTGAKRKHPSMALASRERVLALIDRLVQVSRNPLYSESQAVNAVIELASKHLLDRVRRCSCGRWLFQTRKGKREQLHCGDACRKKAFRKTRQVK